MKVHQHGTTNMLLTAPENLKNCDTVPATMVIDNEVPGEGYGVRVLTYWRPTEEELKLLNAGCSVCLHVYGGTHPPVAITVEL